ncbi:hypothetical protein L3X38_025821 [Prunus dulcis]|uniref:Uncharacterized protein n=1 Tax=Prunus dulcis TaxID=3755 RepID=A0AAD4W552_PRUDU|nr:hypothetical protein L3X38_025821 [Prunus dulcis]
MAPGQILSGFSLMPLDAIGDDAMDASMGAAVEDAMGDVLVTIVFTENSHLIEETRRNSWVWFPCPPEVVKARLNELTSNLPNVVPSFRYETKQNKNQKGRICQD